MSSNDNFDPIREKEEHEDVKAGAATAAAGLGCLGFALMPFTFMLIIFLIFAVAWIIYRV